LVGINGSHTLLLRFHRTKTEMYRHLSLDIEHHEGKDDTGPVSVKKCLEQFFQEEERELKCEKCTNGETASQTLRLLNRYVVICLMNCQGFQYHGS
jgi:uncharacterized UBP type Zn finger protein